MSVVSTPKSTLSLLAERIEGDVRSRGLRSGDRYRTSSEVGLMLGVSTATAHRAMALLIDKKVLIRQHGRGTFIGPAVVARQGVRVRTVYILMTEGERSAPSLPMEVMVDAIRDEMDANVQFCYVPAQGAVDYVREVVQSAQHSGQFAGAVAISCPREVYAYLAGCGGAAVVLGTLYSDQRTLFSIDLDYHQSGYLLTKYLIRRGHTRMVLFARGTGRPGDSAFFDGVSEAVTEAGLPHKAMIVRVFPQDFDAFRAQVTDVLSREDRPSGVICRSEWMVETVVSVADCLGLTVGRNLEIVFEEVSTAGTGRLSCPRVRPQQPFGKIARMIAWQLHRLAEGRLMESDHVVVPVELQEPGGNRRPIAIV